MSIPSSALTNAQSMSSEPARKQGCGFFREVFNAWMAAFGNRIDSNGNVMCEL